MIHPPPMFDRRPPRLSMDEYADFVEASLRESDRAYAARQKQIEKRVRSPFVMSGAHSEAKWKLWP